jgi:hypothetical protein
VDAGDSSQPIADAYVYVPAGTARAAQAGGTGNLAEATTDASGRYVLEGLPAGEHTVFVDAGDASYVDTSFPVGIFDGLDDDVRVPLVKSELDALLDTLAVDPWDFQALPGDEVECYATVIDKEGRLRVLAPVWTVTGGVGTISDDGLFKATQAGTGKIIATIGGRSASTNVEVVDVAQYEWVWLDVPFRAMAVGDWLWADAAAVLSDEPQPGETIEWSTDPPGILQLSETSTLTDEEGFTSVEFEAVSAGRVTLKASLGQSAATQTLVVTEEPALQVWVDVVPPSFGVGETSYATAYVTLYGEPARDVPVYFEATDTDGVATAAVELAQTKVLTDEYGIAETLITGKQAGAGAIKVKADGVKDNAGFLVTSSGAEVLEHVLFQRVGQGYHVSDNSPYATADPASIGASASEASEVFVMGNQRKGSKIIVTNPVAGYPTWVYDMLTEDRITFDTGNYTPVDQPYTAAIGRLGGAVYWLGADTTGTALIKSKLDGSERQVLIADTADAYRLALSPDSSRLALITVDQRLFTVRVDGSRLQEVNLGGSLYATNVDWLDGFSMAVVVEQLEGAARGGVVEAYVGGDPAVPLNLPDTPNVTSPPAGLAVDGGSSLLIGLGVDNGLYGIYRALEPDGYQKVDEIVVEPSADDLWPMLVWY